ncbi:MAG: hypothetical protein SWQ30_12810 [Thermodesulfobacteriota bacterium]|nr:hypothetical protein [Thermodesulfobacteriota bacterium]
MQQQAKKFQPIDLPDTNVIWSARYVIAYVEGAGDENTKRNDGLGVDFRVCKGKHRGLGLSTHFPATFKGKRRLSHFCRAVGIFGRLESPDQLVGKKLRLRVVPSYYFYRGRRYREYRITRFHPV